MTLKTCAGAPRYILPSRCDVDTPMSRVSFNPVTSAIAERAGKGGPRLSSSPCTMCGERPRPSRKRCMVYGQASTAEFGGNRSRYGGSALSGAWTPTGFRCLACPRSGCQVEVGLLHGRCRPEAIGTRSTGSLISDPGKREQQNSSRTIVTPLMKWSFNATDIPEDGCEDSKAWLDAV